MNFTKFKYEAQQRAKESRKKATNITVKEMKYRPKIGGGDFDTKTRKVAQFLGEGHKVKVTIMFRGREMQHPELGRRILDRVAGEVDHVGRVEIMPKQDGRNMTMVLGPDKKAQAAHAKKLQAEAAEAADADGADARRSGRRRPSPETDVDGRRRAPWPKSSTNAKHDLGQRVAGRGAPPTAPADDRPATDTDARHTESRRRPRARTGRRQPARSGNAEQETRNRHAQDEDPPRCEEARTRSPEPARSCAAR